MEQICPRCKGKGLIKKSLESFKDICESCGGYGTNSWIGNIMGKPDRVPVLELIKEVVHEFQFELEDNRTVSALNSSLEELLKETNLILEVDKMTKDVISLKGRLRKNE